MKWLALAGILAASALLGPLLLLLLAVAFTLSAALAVVLSLAPVYKSRQSGPPPRRLTDGGRLRAASRAS